MDKNKKKGKVIENDLLGLTAEDIKQDRVLNDDKSSVVATNLFSKKDSRKNNSFGPGHEPGATT